MGMLGIGLVFVGFVLLINGMQLLGILKDKDVIPMNIFTGILIFAGVMRTIVWQGTNITQYFYSMQSLLFAFTYLWLSINLIWKLNGKGLGWYCLLVAIICIPTAFTALPDIGLFILWIMWASLWLLFYFLLGLGKNIAKSTGIWTIINGIVTGVSGYLILTKVWPWL